MGTKRAAAGLAFACALLLPATAAGQFSPQYMRYVGASVDGTRVFMETYAQLVPADTDAKADIYERAGGETTLITPGTASDQGFFGMFNRASADGARVFFRTNEQLVAADTDSTADIYERSGDAYTLISQGEIDGDFTLLSFQGLSADGTHVFFTTDGQFVAADTDSSTDVYERSGGATTLVTAGEINGNGAFDPHFVGFSSDGAKAFFTTAEQLVSADTDGADDVYQRAGGTTTLVSVGEINGNGANHASFSRASADGSRVFFSTDEQLVDDDSDNSPDVYERSSGTTTLISAGEINGNGAFIPILVGPSADGSRVFFTTAEQLTAGDSDTYQDVYERSGGTTTLVTETNGSADTFSTGLPTGISTDGSRVFFVTAEALLSGDTDASDDVYQRSGGETALVSAGEINGNGAFPAGFAGASSDGTLAFFRTTEQLVPADMDSTFDIYERSAGATTLVSAGEINGNGALPAGHVGASSDGTRVFFITDEQLVPADVDAALGEEPRDIYERLGGETKLVSLEMIPPETAIADGPAGRTHDRTPTFELAANEDGSSFQCKVDSKAFRGCEPSTTLRRQGRGRHVFRARAIDPAGNEDATPAKQRFRVVKR